MTNWEPVKLTESEWLDHARRRYGPDPMGWKFVCPVCGHVAAVRDWQTAGAPSGAVAFSCVGRWLDDSANAFEDKFGPCNYAGGGLFRLNPIEIVDRNGSVFDFADEPLLPDWGKQ